MTVAQARKQLLARIKANRTDITPRETLVDALTFCYAKDDGTIKGAATTIEAGDPISDPKGVYFAHYVFDNKINMWTFKEGTYVSGSMRAAMEAFG